MAAPQAWKNKQNCRSSTQLKWGISIRKPPSKRLPTIPPIKNCSQKPTGASPTTRTLAALAAFQRTFVFLDAPFDRFLAGEEQAISDTAKKGWVLFNGKARCVTCHTLNRSNPLGTNNRFHNFHGMLSTAWPWPYAPEGLPPLTIQMGRSDPFNPNDGCGDGHAQVHPEGLIDKVYNLWNRNPVRVARTYLASNGATDHPAYVWEDLGG